jgi:hypothetical protein
MVKDGGAHAGRRQVSLASEGAEEGETRRVTEAKSFRHIIPPCVYRLGCPSMEVKKVEAKTILDEIPKPNGVPAIDKKWPTDSITLLQRVQFPQFNQPAFSNWSFVQLLFRIASKEHDFRKGLNPPNQRANGRQCSSKELGLIRGFIGILAFIGEVPNDLLQHTLLKCNVPMLGP